MTNLRLGSQNGSPGDRIWRGRDNPLEVVEVRDRDEILWSLSVRACREERLACFRAGPAGVD